MLKELKFVQGAVAKKDFVPALKHFLIRGGRVTGYNGQIALSTPIALDLDAAPRAEPFVRAIGMCEEEISLSMTPAGKLAIKSGKFKAFIDCTTEPFPEVQLQGNFVEASGSFLQALRELLPFVGDDASRPWAMGVLLRGQSIYATNNVIAVERWLGFTVPVEINIPKSTINELLRIGQEPLGLQVADNAVTFYFEGGRWLNSVLYSTEWPGMDAILARQFNPQPVAKPFFEAVESVMPFSDKLRRVYLSPALVSTSPLEADGASMAAQVPALGADGGCFNGDMLALVGTVAEYIDLAPWPAPCGFYGRGLRGVIVGMRKEPV